MNRSVVLSGWAFSLDCTMERYGDPFTILILVLKSLQTRLSFHGSCIFCKLQLFS